MKRMRDDLTWALMALIAYSESSTMTFHFHELIFTRRFQRQSSTIFGHDIISIFASMGEASAIAPLTATHKDAAIALWPISLFEVIII